MGWVGLWENKGCLTEKQYLQTKDASRLFLLITSEGVLGNTTVTVMEKSRLRRKWYQSSNAETMEHFPRLIIWKHLALHNAFLLSGISEQN